MRACNVHNIFSHFKSSNACMQCPYHALNLIGHLSDFKETIACIQFPCHADMSSVTKWPFGVLEPFNHFWRQQTNKISRVFLFSGSDYKALNGKRLDGIKDKVCSKPHNVPT